jgi:hypothetical protein
MIKMRISSTIVQEVLSRYNVKDWNELQMQIWMHLVQDNIVDRNDLKTFFDFGQEFSDYFEAYGKVIPYEILKKRLVGV